MQSCKPLKVEEDGKRVGQGDEMGEEKGEGHSVRRTEGALSVCLVIHTSIHLAIP